MLSKILDLFRKVHDGEDQSVCIALTEQPSVEVLPPKGSAQAVTLPEDFVPAVEGPSGYQSTLRPDVEARLLHQKVLVAR